MHTQDGPSLRLIAAANMRIQAPPSKASSKSVIPESEAQMEALHDDQASDRSFVFLPRGMAHE